MPAMVFLGLVMMPFYYGSKVRSVPEYLRLRFNRRRTCSTRSPSRRPVLIAGVNLYALALVMQALLGWPHVDVDRAVGAAIVLGVHHARRAVLGAIYNEVLQFFVILAGLIPMLSSGCQGRRLGRTERHGLAAPSSARPALHAWGGTGSATRQPARRDWIAIVFGLGFVLSFGYWTTNFAEVQRALSAKNLSAARRTPLIAAYPKMFIPSVTIIPGLIAAGHRAGPRRKTGDLQYNNAIPLLMRDLLPNGVLGHRA